MIKLDKSLTKVSSILINVVLITLSFVLMLVMYTSLWNWFIAPLGVPVIGYAQAFGLSLLVTYFQVRNPKMFKPDVLVQKTYRQRLGFNIGVKAMALVLGSIAHLCM